MHAEPCRARGPAAAAFGALLPALLGAVAALPGCAPASLAARHRALEGDWQRSEPAGPGAPAELRLSGSPALERAALVEEVLRRNRSLEAARQAWRAALARYPQVVSLDDPRLGAGVAPASFGSPKVRDSYRVDLSQRLPFPGKLALRGEVALAEAEAAARDFEAVELRLAALASILFDDYTLAARAREINAEHVALLEELQEVALARYRAGEAPQQAPLQAEVELAHLAHREVALATEGRIVAEQINALLHRDPALPLPPPPPALAPAGPEPGDPDLAAALAASPELRAAQAQVRAREAAVDLARREFLPDVTVAGAWDALWQERDLRPVVGVEIDLPLRLDRRRAALEEAHARLEGARREQERIEDEVRLGVASSVDRLREAQHLLHLSRDRLLPAARDQLEAARAGFEAGRVDFPALIEAERALRSARLGHEEALADVSRRAAELERATGIRPGRRSGGER